MVVFFVVLLVGVGIFIFCVLLNIFSLSCFFVTGLFTFFCVFSRCRLFLWLVLVQFLQSTILVVKVFFKIIPFRFHFSWNFILSFIFSIGNSPFFLLLFVCSFKYILCFMLGRFVRIILFIICWTGDGDPSFKGVVLSDNRAKYGSCLLSYAFVGVCFYSLCVSLR